MIIYSIQTVYEIDRTNSSSNIYIYMRHSRAFGYHELSDIFKQMAIVIPVKNEKLSVLEGVLSGIPNEILIIIVSNSERTSNVDRYSMEVEMVKQYARFTDKRIMVIHQKDEELGKNRRKTYTILAKRKDILSRISLWLTIMAISFIRKEKGMTMMSIKKIIL